jgi:hypothetical protein
MRYLSRFGSLCKKQWQVYFPLIKIVERDPYFENHDWECLEKWGAHAIVAFEQTLFYRTFSGQEMIKVNRPRVLLSNVSMGGAIEALVAHYAKQSSKIISLTIMYPNQQILYFPFVP